MFITGILQFGLAWIIIGWGWSIWWGVRMFQDAQTRKDREESQRMANVINAGISVNTITLDSQDPVSTSINTDNHNQRESAESEVNPEQTNSINVTISEDHPSNPSS